jgi:tetratricopeptide (TPR) repeat protein
VLPDVIRTSQITEDLYSAKLNLNLRIEDMEGNTIYQQEKNLDFRLDGKQKKAIDEKKAMFSGFAPIISGIFNVNIVLANKTTEEFFVYEERLELDHETVPVLLGYKAEESLSDSFVPFSTDKHKMSFDPRYVYNKTGSIEGIVFADSKPQIYLINVDDESDTFEILDIEEQGRYFVFKQPLADKKSSNYYFSVMISGEEVYRKIIAVLPFLANKPVTFDWFDPLTSGPAYNFEIATQHLHVGNTEAALEYFNEIPENLWNSFTIPTIAKAYYQKKDYKKVVELLEREGVTKNYSALLLLGNSCLELKQLGKAAEYFEQLRNYGDTVRINHILGAVFLSLGDREKAKAYYDRAKELEGKSEVKKEEKRQ